MTANPIPTRRGFRVIVYMESGDPEGLKVVDNSNWTGSGFVIPRAMFVESHGRMTRRDVAELCKIGGFQAMRLLDRLVIGGRLERIGQRRGTWYSRGMVV